MLSVPILEAIGNVFVVSWDEGVEITFQRLYDHRDYHVDAEITVIDEEELNPRLLGPVRTSITKTWRQMVSDLEEVSERPDWRQRLRQASQLVLDSHRSGAPVVALGDYDPPEPTAEMLQGIIWEGMPTLVYGPGGIGKSIIGLNILSAIHTGRAMAGLETKQSNSLILDWETSDRQTWWRNSEILRAQDISPKSWEDPDAPESGRTGMVFYRFMHGPLADDVEYLRQQIAEKNIGTICVDSAGPACGGEPESAGATLKFFESLRMLTDHDKPLQSLIIAHVTHAAKQGITKRSPFGSVYWTNIPRQVFELQSAQTEGANHSDYALHHRKSNLGPLQKPLAFRLTWGQGCIIEPLDLRSNARLVAGLDLPDRARILIEEGGAMPATRIADITGLTERVINTELGRDSRFILDSGGAWSASQSDW